jgi:nucleotide-binding universal stress UspA family protein
MMAFRSIVCAVDGSAAGREAARQAAVLARRDAELLLVGAGDLEGAEAERALKAASALAAERGVAASARLAGGANPPGTLLEVSATADLLVVGGSGGPRDGGVLLGSTASSAVHTASLPVLVARPAADDREFPAVILVATDGSHESDRGIDLAARIATAHGSVVTLLHVSDGQSHSQQVLARGVAALREVGVEAATIEEFGTPAQRLSEVAGRERASLIVIGSRGIGRARTLGSVSERVGHEAPCSVLIVR